MMKNKDTKEKKLSISFSALDPYIERNIVLPTEREIKGQGFVEFGDYNSYPQYLFSLYKDCSTLQSIVNGIKDYVVGDKVEAVLPIVDDVEVFVSDFAFSYALYGGVYLNVLRNKLNQVCSINVLDYRKVRTNKENTMFYYSEDFVNGKSYGRCKMLVLPAFDKDATDGSSIYYYTNNALGVYALPLWSGAVYSAETDVSINKFQLNTVKNSFSSNFIVSLNNGTPTDEEKEEIEELFYEKFCGEDNAGTPLIFFGQDKDHGVEIHSIDQKDFADKYDSISQRVKNELFTAFRAHPVLFGLPTVGTGFNDQDFQEAFKLFSRTVIRPIQKKIVNILSMFGEYEFTIKPFTIDWDEDTNKNNEEVENE